MAQQLDNPVTIKLDSNFEYLSSKIERLEQDSLSKTMELETEIADLKTRIIILEGRVIA